MDGTWAKKSWHRRRKQPEDETQRTPTPPPRILPAHRPRALTLSSGDISATRIADQSNSGLLGKLPFELRQMIWRKCVGVHAYDLEILRSVYPERFNGAIQISCYEQEVWKGLDGNGIPRHSENDWNSMSRVPRDSDCKIGIVSILLSCRQV